MVDCCNKYMNTYMNKINPFFSEISQQTQNIYETHCHNYSNLAWSLMLFYMHHQYLITVQNMNKINPLSSEIANKNKMYEKVAKITQIWHRAKCYFTSMSNIWYPITLPNMTTITTSFSEISQETLKIYEKLAINTHIWHGSQILLI